MESTFENAGQADDGDGEPDACLLREVHGDKLAQVVARVFLQVVTGEREGGGLCGGEIEREGGREGERDRVRARARARESERERERASERERERKRERGGGKEGGTEGRTDGRRESLRGRPEFPASQSQNSVPAQLMRAEV